MYWKDNLPNVSNNPYSLAHKSVNVLFTNFYNGTNIFQLRSGSLGIYHWREEIEFADSLAFGMKPYVFDALFFWNVSLRQNITALYLSAFVYSLYVFKIFFAYGLIWILYYKQMFVRHSVSLLPIIATCISNDGVTMQLLELLEIVGEFPSNCTLPSLIRLIKWCKPWYSGPGEKELPNGMDTASTLFDHRSVWVSD